MLTYSLPLEGEKTQVSPTRFIQLARREKRRTANSKQQQHAAGELLLPLFWESELVEKF